MINFLHDNPNTRKFPKRTAALAALIAASALSLVGCNRTTANDGYLRCTGSQSYTVEPEDTLGGILLKKTEGVDEANVKDIARAVAKNPAFEGDGGLPALNVPHYVDGTQQPDISAGATVDIPRQCSDN